MSREPVSNIELYCEHHSPGPNPALHGLKPEEYVGLFVKRSFPVTPQSRISSAISVVDDKVAKEHMWIKVTGVDGRQLVGTVANDPVYDVGVKFDDVITFPITDIEQVSK